jgi:hypothetical protein
MSFTTPSHVSAHPRRGTPVAGPSAEAAQTERASATQLRAASDRATETPEPHWQASIESATD